MSPGTWLLYYTIVLEWSARPTPWHPTDREPPFSTLTRGSFKSELAARLWAEEHIPTHPYDLARIELETDGSDTFEQFVGVA